MSRYQKPNWAFFFFLEAFSWKRTQKIQTSHFFKVTMSSCSAKQGFCAATLERTRFSTSRHSNMIPSESPHCSFLYRDGSAGTQCIRCVLRTRLHAAISLVLLISLSKVTLSLKRKVYKVKKKKKNMLINPSPLSPFPKLAPWHFLSYTFTCS